MLKSRREGNKSYALESHAAEMENNKKTVILNKVSNNHIHLVLEPNKFDQLSSECRLTSEEYIDAIDALLTSEEKEWHELRMKDQVNMTRDEIIKETILKYSKEHFKIDKKDFDGVDINYSKRYTEGGTFVGETITVSLHKLS